VLEEPEDHRPVQRQRRIRAARLVPRPDEADEKRVEDLAERLYEPPQRPERFRVVRLRGRPAPEELELVLPPGVAFLGAEDARIDLEQSPSSFKRLFASLQRRIQPRTSSTEDIGT
jgi:chromatin segregation and condensation protein Rec8/ScpA/Scc1 (kleisin family)